MNQPAVNKRQRRSLHRWMMDVLGNEWCSNSGIPRDNRTIYIHDDGVYRVFVTMNDGFEVGIGYPDKWQVIMRYEAAKMFAWWLFKVWVRDLFGLRTYLWYRALFRSCSKTGRWERPTRHPKMVWKSSFEAWENSDEGRQHRAMHRADWERDHVSDS